MHFVVWEGGGFCIVGVGRGEGREGANIRGIALLCPSGLAWLGDAGYWMGVDEMGIEKLDCRELDEYWEEWKDALSVSLIVHVFDGRWKGSMASCTIRVRENFGL